MEDQKAKAELFRSLHARPGTFLIPNPWDAGTAILLAGLGFEALATTSAGLAFALGRRDAGGLTREEVIANVRAIAQATSLPVSADLENGYADDPKAAAQTLVLAAEAGAVGGSLEDATGNDRRPIYDFAHSVERVAAAVEAVKALPIPFVFTARAENFLYGKGDLDDTIRRLQAYEKAGADVLYAPALPSFDAIKEVCSALKKPVNALAGARHTLTVTELASAGVKRISVGSAFNRAALGAFLRAAREFKDAGTVAFIKDCVPYAEIMSLMPHNPHT
jgi:2-methylisocitrate lyase-like PEP mutase family enzyme